MVKMDKREQLGQVQWDQLVLKDPEDHLVMQSSGSQVKEVFPVDRVEQVVQVLEGIK